MSAAEAVGTTNRPTSSVGFSEASEDSPTPKLIQKSLRVAPESGATAFGLTESLTNREVRRLQPLSKQVVKVLRHFDAHDRPRVLAYLLEQPDLAPVILEAEAELRLRFPHSRLTLTIVGDPAGIDGDLFVEVFTSLPVAEAYELLVRFDDEWLIAASRRVRGAFNVNLRFE